MADMTEIKDMIDQAAGDLAQAAPLDRWAGWLVYLLQCLEVKAMDIDQDHPQAFEDALQAIQDAIADRLNAGRW